MTYDAYMCNRYSIKSNLEAIRDLFHFKGSPNLPPRYNVAPTQSAPVVRLSSSAGDRRRELASLRWGLVPPSAPDPKAGKPMTIARADAVTRLRTFRQAFQERRCLVIADGFYEWITEGKERLPYRITLPDDSPFAMAGVWEYWQDRKSGGEVLESFAIITTEPNAAMRPIHDRMPVLLPPVDHEAWLRSGNPGEALALLRPYEGELSIYRVSQAVNNWRNDTADCIAPLA
jgi:putative SOS response-associated peptidase YedK